MLKNGSINLFNKNLEEKEAEFTEEQIDALLDRDSIGNMNSELEKEGESTKKNKLFVRNDLNDYYLSGFKFQSLSFQSYNDHGENEMEIEEKNKYWDTILGKDALLFQEQEHNELGKGKRIRKTVSNKLNEDSSDGKILTLFYN